MRETLLRAAVAAATLSASGAEKAFAGEIGETPRRVSVTGVGEAAGEPDLATVSIGVRSQGASPGEAVSRNNEQMSTTIDALKSLGIAPKDLQTAALSVNPEVDYSQSRSQPRITGYAAQNTLTVRIRDIERTGAILDQAVKAGANQLNALRFGFSDPDRLLDAARVDAVEDAKRKAAIYAKAAGVSLGPVLTITEGASATPVVAKRFRAEAAAVDAAPIETGEATLSAAVTLVYAIE